MFTAITHSANVALSVIKLALDDPACYRSVRCAHGPAGPVWGNWRSNQFDLVSMCSHAQNSFLAFPETTRPSPDLLRSFAYFLFRFYGRSLRPNPLRYSLSRLGRKLGRTGRFLTVRCRPVDTSFHIQFSTTTTKPRASDFQSYSLWLI